MGLLDFLTGGNSNSDPNSSGTPGAFGLDPATAQQIQKQQAWSGLLGYLSAAGQSSAPSRLPIPLGVVMGNALQGMQNANISTTDQAAKMAQTADTMSQTQLRKIQGNAQLIGLQNQQQMLQALQKYYAGGNGGDGNTAPPLVPNGTSPNPIVNNPATSTPSANPSDPRNMIPVIQADATKYGIDPATAVQVASTEGLGGGSGDGGQSHGAFQLYTGGGLGNDFKRDTGLNPADPANEPATIDYALKHAAQYGWGAFHGARNNGIGNWQGIARPTASGGATASNPPEYFLGTMTADDSPTTNGVSPDPRNLQGIGAGLPNSGNVSGIPVNPMGGPTSYGGAAGVSGMQGSPSGPAATPPPPAPTMTSYGGAAGIPGLRGSPSGPAATPPSSMNGGMGVSPTGSAGVQGLQGSPSGTTAPQGLLAAAAAAAAKPAAPSPQSPSGAVQYPPASVQELGPAAVQQWTQKMQSLGYNVGNLAGGNLPPGVAALAQGLLGALSQPASGSPSPAASPAAPTPGLINPQAGALNPPPAAPPPQGVPPSAAPQGGSPAQGGLPAMSPNFTFGTNQAPNNAGHIVPPSVPDYGVPPAGSNAGAIPPGYQPPSPTAGATFGPMASGSSTPPVVPPTGAGSSDAPGGAPSPAPTAQPVAQNGMIPNVVGVPGMPAMPSPQKIQQSQALAAQMSVLGMKVPPDLEALSKFPVDLALANAKAYAEKAAENQFAGSIATQQQQARVGPESAINANRANAESYYRALYAGQQAQGEAAGKESGNPTLVTVTVPDGAGGFKEVQVPKSQYLSSTGQPGQPSGQPDTASGAIPGANLPGKPIVNPQIDQNLKVYQPAIDADTKRIADTLQPAADTATKTMGTASLIHDLIPTVSTGWGADARQQGAKILSAMGGSDQDLQKGILGVNPANGDAIRKLFLQQSAEAVRAMGAREPGSVISLFANAYPNLQSQPNAIKLMESVFQMQAQRDLDHLTQAQQYQQGQLANVGKGQPYSGLAGFEGKFNNPQGNTSSVYYSKAAEAMAGQPNWWSGMSQKQLDQVFNLVPAGSVIPASGSPTGKEITR